MTQTFGLLEQYKKPFVFASSQMSQMSYSPYGVMKRMGELYTESLNGLIVKFWNVYGIEKDMDKAMSLLISSGRDLRQVLLIC